jgi:hypothetical protein
MSVEYVIIVPMLFLVFSLIYAYGRVAQVGGTIDSGTRDAARVATLARSYQEASSRAVQVVREAIGSSSRRCLSTLSVDVSPRTFQPGDTITVKAQCSYPLSDLGLPGAPGTITVHSQFSSMLDPNRGVQ